MFLDGPNPYGIGWPLPAGAFDLDLVFVDGHRLSTEHMQLFEDAARRWEGVITEDLPDDTFAEPLELDDFDWWAPMWRQSRGSARIEAGPLDDLRVYISTNPRLGGSAVAGSFFFRTLPSGMPLTGFVLVSESILDWPDDDLLAVMVHELGHVLGFGSSWMWDQWIEGEDDPHFTGPEARETFGGPVPVEPSSGHWRESVFGPELMTPRLDGSDRLSRYTLAAFLDLGYGVDLTRADPYTRP